MYAIVDIETTGGNALSDRITEIAIVKHDGNTIVEEFCTLVHPERRVPYRISSITGITNEMLQGAPKFYEVAKKVVELTEGCTFVAHNAKFDYNFVRNEFRSLGFDFKMQTLCTLELSRKLLPGLRSYSLGQICQALGIEGKTWHRALADAQAAASLLMRLLQLGPSGSTENGGKILSRMNPDANLKKEQIDKLPNETGVYYFYDQHHQLIYVGKSVDIRSRVLSHFANNNNVKALEMKRSIAHIRYAVTGSELVALLKESDEIKRMRPVFNRAQRRSRFHVGVFSGEDCLGYMQFHIGQVRKGGPDPITAFASQREARAFLERMVEEYSLCQRLAGLQKGKGPCFYHSIHRCAGACVGIESVKEYNQRAVRIMEGFQFAGPNLLIVDKGRNEDEKALVMVEKGKYLGYGYVETELLETDVNLLRKCVNSYADNKDVRQIIQLFLRLGKAERIIVFS